jgi:type IV secretory pathway VirB4 component
MLSIINHKDKVDFILNFLRNKDNKHYLIIIGKSGTGKTSALNEALDKSNEIDNIYIWNKGKNPYLINFNCVNTLHIFIRYEEDNLVKCLQNEFDCVTAQFEEDDTINVF